MFFCFPVYSHGEAEQDVCDWSKESDPTVERQRETRKLIQKYNFIVLSAVEYIREVVSLGCVPLNWLILMIIIIGSFSENIKAKTATYDSVIK